jgi:hypothetical protein
MKLVKLLLALCSVLALTLPILAQDQNVPVNVSNIDTSKIEQSLIDAGVNPVDITEIKAAVKAAVEDGGVSVTEARKLINLILLKKEKYTNLKDQLKTDIIAAVDSMKEAVKQGVTEKEARAMIGITVLDGIDEGMMGNMRDRMTQCVTNMIAERATIKAAAKKKKGTAKEKVEEAIKEKIGEETAPTVTPVGKEIPRKPRK